MRSPQFFWVTLYHFAKQLSCQFFLVTLYRFAKHLIYQFFFNFQFSNRDPIREVFGHEKAADFIIACDAKFLILCNMDESMIGDPIHDR